MVDPAFMLTLTTNTAKSWLGYLCILLPELLGLLSVSLHVQRRTLLYLNQQPLGRFPLYGMKRPQAVDLSEVCRGMTERCVEVIALTTLLLLLMETMLHKVKEVVVLNKFTFLNVLFVLYSDDSVAVVTSCCILL
jgi:hypothetical protein